MLAEMRRIWQVTAGAMYRILHINDGGIQVDGRIACSSCCILFNLRYAALDLKWSLEV